MRMWRREVGPTGESTLLAVRTEKRHLWREWVTTRSHGIQMGPKQVEKCAHNEKQINK